MAESLQCPRCHRQWDVSDSLRSQDVTCPSCGGKVTVADRRPAAAAPAPAPVVSQLSVPSSEGGLCPSCQRKIEAGWRACPYCTARLEVKEALPADQEPEIPRRIVRRPAVAQRERDMHKDTAYIGLALVGIGALGTIFLIGSLLTRGLPDNLEGFFVLGAIVFIISIVGVAVGATSRHSGSAATIGLTGGLTIMAVLFGLPFALFIAFLNACSKGCK